METGAEGRPRSPRALFIYGEVPVTFIGDYQLHVSRDPESLKSHVRHACVEVQQVVVIVGTSEDGWNIMKGLPQHVFAIYWHPHATEEAAMRAAAFAAGFRMVTCSNNDVNAVLNIIAKQSCSGRLCCEWCCMPQLDPEDLWHHYQLYHINEPNIAGVCQICSRQTKSLMVHVHDKHEPSGQPEEARTGVFALVVVCRPTDGKFLMSQEFAGVGFWLPGGGVLPGETLIQGAVRECLEEAGVAVQVKGLLEVTASSSRSWRRVIFYAEPEDVLAAPKTIPDFESAGACWVGAEELASIPLRSAKEPTTWFPYIAGGGQIKPLQLSEQDAAAFVGFPLGEAHHRHQV